MNRFGKTLLLGAVIIFGAWAVSCKKEKEKAEGCYDASYHEQHRNDICTADCPGVIGCDGKSYCNECVMHTNGITRTQ